MAVPPAARILADPLLADRQDVRKAKCSDDDHPNDSNAADGDASAHYAGHSAADQCRALGTYLACCCHS